MSLLFQIVVVVEQEPVSATLVLPGLLVQQEVRVQEGDVLDVGQQRHRVYQYLGALFGLAVLGEFQLQLVPLSLL